MTPDSTTSDNSRGFPLVVLFALIIFTAGLQLTSLGLQFFVLNPVAQDNREEIRGLVGQQHVSDLEACARTNDSRVASIEDRRGDARVMEAQLALWVAAAAASPPNADAPPRVLEAFTGSVEELRRGIHRKRKLIHESIAAQAPVAIKKGSPIVDCQRAYPAKP